MFYIWWKSSIFLKEVFIFFFIFEYLDSCYLCVFPPIFRTVIPAFTACPACCLKGRPCAVVASWWVRGRHPPPSSPAYLIPTWWSSIRRCYGSRWFPTWSSWLTSAATRAPSLRRSSASLWTRWEKVCMYRCIFFLLFISPFFSFLLVECL